MTSSVVEQSSPIQDSISSPSKGRKGICQVCQIVHAKYTCPQCGTNTCSVACVKEHKLRKDGGCLGVRDKTAYVPMDTFSDIHLLSDYRFLEDVARQVDNDERVPSKRVRPGHPKHAKILAWQAKRRRIRFQLLPNTFTKNLINKSYYCFKTRIISWHVVWVFPQAALASEQKVEFTDKVEEAVILGDALKKYVNPSMTSEPIDGVHKLGPYVEYQRQSTEELKALMKAEGRPHKGDLYHRLDLKRTLGDNLRNKVMVEFPTIVVVLPNHSNEYEILAEEH